MPAENIKVSIIIPVYNVEEYLPKCLDSVVNQTLKDIEVICVDDCSTDSSYEILQEYASKDDRIVVLKQEINQGVSSARNKGLETAQGEYVMFVDSDDYLELSACNDTYNEAIKHEAQLVVFNMYYAKKNSKKVANYLDSINLKSFQFCNCPMDFYYILTSAGAKLYKNSLQTFNENIVKGEDTIYFWEFCLKNNPKIAILKSPLYNYVQHDDNCSYNDEHIKNSELIKTINQFIMLNCFKNADNKIQIRILDRYAQSLWWEIHSFSTRNKKSLPNEYYKKINQFIKLFSKYDKKVIKSLKYYSQLKKEITRSKYYEQLNLLQEIFSVTNNLKTRRKIVNVLGVKIKFKYLKGQFKKEEQIINNIKHNQKKYPKDSYLLFDNLNGDIAECIDAYSLFRYLKSQGKKAYYVLLKDTSLYKELASENNLDNIIALDNPMTTHPGDFFEAVYTVLLRAKAVITAFGVFSRPGQRFIKNNKYWKYIFIQHGPTFLKETVMTNGYLIPEKFDKILISSDYEYKIFKKYGWSDNKLLKCGLPRWDLLAQENKTKEKSILVMFTWRRFDICQFEESLYKKNIYKLLSNSELQNLLKKYDIKLYFAPHHSLLGLRGINFNLNIDNITCIDSTNISKYIRECNCLITDWSSVAFDFMFQNKPVIYYILDKGDEILGAADREDIRHFDYKKYTMPNVLYNEEHVIQKLTYYIKNNFELEQETKNKYDKFFYTKENIREQLVKEIDKIF